MERKEWMKWVGTVALSLCALAAMIFSVTAARRAGAASAEEESETQTEPESRPEGLLANVYIESGEEALTLWYEGERFTMEGTPASPYSGVADIVVRDGQIVRIDAKTEYIEGILDSYTGGSVQISGYELLRYAGTLPVYALSGAGTFLGQRTLGDLVVGTSQVRLVVAYGEACALLQVSEDVYENIRVLIKNGSALTYDELYLTSDRAYQAGDTAMKKNKAVSAAKLFRDSEVGEEIRVSSKGLLYLCDKKGTRKGEGYEGDFLMRKAKEGYLLINELPIETYLRYVVPSEMPSYYSYEALKAQAVCARTYAYQQLQNRTYAAYGANLDDSTSFQVYHAQSPAESTSRAVADTEGLVLTYGGALIDSYYYSTGSGYSEDLKVWNCDSPDYLAAENQTREPDRDLSKEKQFHAFITDAPDSYDKGSPYYRWTAELSAKQDEDARYGRLKRLVVNQRSSSGYILSLTAVFEDGERIYENENEIRFSLGKYIKKITLADGSVRTGSRSIPSACFEVTSQKDGTITLTGGGFGHGIGMSQYGAGAMAEEGKNWQEILAFYYKGAKVVKR